MNRSYFFVRTPIQYYNAIEAKESLPKNSQCFLIILSDYPKTLNQFKELVDHEMWLNVLMPWKKYGDLTKSNFLNRILNITRRFSLNAIFRSIEDSDTIFWGNYNSIWLRYFLEKKKNNVTILDDGFAALSISKYIHKNKLLFNKSTGFSGLTERLFVTTSRNIELSRLTFFTSFKNISNAMTRQSIVTDYPYLKTLGAPKSKDETDDVYFIGQPLILLSILEKETYINHVNQIFKYYSEKGLKCYYIPHRSTLHDYFPDNWKIINFNFPLEKLLFTSNHVLPKIFASFYSSALYFMNKFSVNDNVSFEFWESQELHKHPNILEVFKYIKSEKLKNTVIHKLDA